MNVIFLETNHINRNCLSMQCLEKEPFKSVKHKATGWNVSCLWSGEPYHGSASEPERKIPLLKEVFHEFPRTPINIDIKVHDEKLIEEVDALVRQFGREHLTVWGNFSHKTTARCYAQVTSLHLYLEPVVFYKLYFSVLNWSVKAIFSMKFSLLSSEQ